MDRYNGYFIKCQFSQDNYVTDDSAKGAATNTTTFFCKKD